MARRSLGHDWHRLTPTQQEEFVQLFSPLLLQSLVKRIAYRATTSAEGYGSVPHAIQYTRETIDPDGDASVQTVMTYAHEQTTEDIEYLLLRRNGTWRVYDVITEGASMVSNYRTQFAQILRQESYNDLIKKAQDVSAVVLITFGMRRGVPRDLAVLSQMTCPWDGKSMELANCMALPSAASACTGVSAVIEKDFVPRRRGHGKAHEGYR